MNLERCREKNDIVCFKGLRGENKKI